MCRCGFHTYTMYLNRAPPNPPQPHPIHRSPTQSTTAPPNPLQPHQSSLWNLNFDMNIMIPTSISIQSGDSPATEPYPVVTLHSCGDLEHQGHHHNTSMLLPDTVFAPEISSRRVHCISLVDVEEWRPPNSSTDVWLHTVCHVADSCRGIDYKTIVVLVKDSTMPGLWPQGGFLRE